MKSLKLGLSKFESKHYALKILQSKNVLAQMGGYWHVCMKEYVTYTATY